MRKTAAWLVRQALEQIGVRYTFGIPGVHNIELYDELNESQQIRPVLVTHEGGAAFMADAVSRVANGPADGIGVLAVVPAAGLTHAMSGIGEAFLDGIPMLVISGGVRTDLQQGFQLHDVDQQALLRPLTKATYKIESYDEVVPTVYRAYRQAVEGEPGPVYIELPANLQLLAGEVGEVPPFGSLGERPAIDPAAIAAAADLLARASRPGIFVGWGARHVADDIRRIAEHLAAPVATTLQGLAAFPGDHPLHTGMGFGPSAVPAAQNAFRGCDAMLAVGTRFAEICTGSYGAVPPANLVHIDINPGAIGRNHPAAVAIPADARDAVPALAARLLESCPSRDSAALQAAIAADKAAWMAEWLAHDSGDRVNPGRFFQALRERLADDAIVVADDGNHTFLTAELLPIHRGGNYLSPTDFNCMGYCVPGCIGAKLARPERQVVGIVGDGAFLMTGLETVTAAREGLGIAWFVFNDGELSQIAQAQEMPYQRKTCTTVGELNYRALAAATGCAFVAIDGDAPIGRGIEEALQHAAAGQPVIVDVRIDYSKPTQFTKGAVKTNIERLDARNKLRIVGRALWRKLTYR
jgi:acetolactate synthase-1/2/3 large subunit